MTPHCCCRDVAEGKRVRRQQLASALTAWWINTQRRAFDAWLDNAHAAIATRQARIAVDNLALSPVSLSLFVRGWQVAK